MLKNINKLFKAQFCFSNHVNAMCSQHSSPSAYQDSSHFKALSLVIPHDLLVPYPVCAICSLASKTSIKMKHTANCPVLCDGLFVTRRRKEEVAGLCTVTPH